MRKLVEKSGDSPPNADELEAWLAELYPTAAKYAASRQEYIAAGKGTPPAKQ
jgi:hypothetical protein